ncbi:MAG: hypothetical protein WC340_02140 [Kiritimatiellia bacterium]
MSISTIPLTEPCKKELLRIVRFVTDQELDTLLKTEPMFSVGGFRSQKPALLRKRLEQLVTGGTSVSTQIRSTLASHARTTSLLSHLSTRTLIHDSVAWAALLGEHVFLVAALLDSRKALREQAELWLDRSPHFLKIESSQALAEIVETFSDLIPLVGAQPGQNIPFTKESWHEQKERLEQRIKVLQSENRRLRGVDDKNNRTNDLLKKEVEKTDALTQKLKSVETQLRQARKELEITTAELQRETSQREERLQAALEISLAQEFHGWLAKARDLEAAVLHPNSIHDAIEFAQNALKKQAQIDRHSHNRLELATRLKQLLELIAQVHATLQSAIHQAPELKQAEERLTHEINTIEGLLAPEQTDITPMEEVLINRIHAAPDEALPRLRTLPKLLKELKILNTNSFKNVESEFTRRLSAIEAIGVPPDPEMQKRTDAASLLGRALAGQAPAILLLDGHNIIFGLPARYMPQRGKAVTDAQKRQNLVDDLIRITSPNPALRVILLFDGPTRSDSTPAPNVSVTYSGGEGEHRADRVIIDKIRFLKTAYPDANLLLVSNDNDLCREARRLGAQNLSVLDFGSYL